MAARLDAAGLAARLGALAAALPTPAPLPLVIPHLEAASPITGFRPPGVPELTDPGAVATAAAATGSGTAIAPSLKDAPVGTRAGPGEIFDAEPYGGSAAAAGGAGRKGPSTAASRSRRRTWWIVAAIAAVVIVAGGLVAAFEAKVFTPSHPTPSLVNLSLAQARSDVAKVHMTLKMGAPVKSITVGERCHHVPEPQGGKGLKEGRGPSVVVSAGPPRCSVPSLTGMNCTQATVGPARAHSRSGVRTAGHTATR